MSKILQAALKGDAALIYQLVNTTDRRKLRYEVNAKTFLLGKTPLLLAVERNHSDCVAALIAAGADLETKGNGGITPLLEASRRGRTDCLLALIHAGADVNPRTQFREYTALMCAAANGHYECVNALLRAGAIVKSVSFPSVTAIKLARWHRHHDIVDLLSAGGETSQQNNILPHEDVTRPIFAFLQSNLCELPDAQSIRAVVSESKDARSTTSLVAWGAINVVVWYALRSAVTSDGGLILGLTMILCGIFSIVFRRGIGTWLNCIALLMVGAWNILNPVLIAAVSNYGRQVSPLYFNVCELVGMSQAITGGVLFGMQFKTRNSHGTINTTRTPAIRAQLLASLDKPALPDAGRLALHLKVYSHTILGFGAQANNVAMQMWLLPDNAYCVDRELSLFVEFRRADHIGKQFHSSNVTITDVDGLIREMSFEKQSLAVFNDWITG